MACGTFATVINCMDGRVQTVVNDYIRENSGVEYVDTITLAGPCRIIAEQQHMGMINNVRFRMDVSVNKHLSKCVFIVGHTDCAAVEVSDEEQRQLVLKSVEEITKWEMGVQVTGLWIDETWTVQEINNVGDAILAGTRA